MRPQRFGIDSECFDDLREKFDSCLEIAMRKMLETGLARSTVVAKVEITTEKQEQEGRTVQLPAFACEVRISMPMKGKVAAAVPAGLKIVQSTENGEFIIASDNYTFFDMMDAGEKER